MIRSIGTPASDAPQRASIISGSSSWFILATIRAGRPARWFSLSRSISSSRRGRIVVGATSSAEQCGSICVAGEIVEEIDDIVREHRVTGKQANVGIEAGGLHVVISGSDMDVAAQTASFLSDDQRCFGVCLKPAYAEGDMRSHALEFGGPVQIALFIEAGLDFHYAGDLFSMFRRADQRFYKRRIVADPVSGHLDRDRMGIICSGADEVFHAGFEAVVRMMNKDVAGLDGGKDRVPVFPK